MKPQMLYWYTEFVKCASYITVYDTLYQGNLYFVKKWCKMLKVVLHVCYARAQLFHYYILFETKFVL